MMYYNDVKLSPQPNDKYKTLKSIRYKDVVVPEGFITNGADIPRVLWSIWPPNRSDYMPAVVIHDYLCDMKEFDKADEYFKEILEELNVGAFTVYSFYYFVKAYHFIRYNVFKPFNKTCIPKS